MNYKTFLNFFFFFKIFLGRKLFNNLYNKAASSFSPFSSAPLTAFPRAFPVASFQGLAAERHYVFTVKKVPWF